MSLVLMRPPEAVAVAVAVAARPLDDAAWFRAAPNAEDGWIAALNMLRRATGAQTARLMACEGQSAWTVVKVGAGEAPCEGALAVVTQDLVSHDGVDYRLVLEGGWSRAEAQRRQGQLGDIRAAAVDGLRTELRVRTAALKMTVATLGRAGLPAIVCTARGRVVTEAFEPAASAHDVPVIAGRLVTFSPMEEEALRAALATAASGQPAVVVLRRESGQPRVFDVMPPCAEGGMFLRRMLLVPRARAGGGAYREQALQQVFGLTSSEVAVGLGISEGLSVSAIARRRSVAASTVRAQLKAVLSKVGVHSQVELAHRLSTVC